MAASNHPSEIIAQAQAAIDQAKRVMAAEGEFLRAQGLNPDKVRSVLESQMSAKDREQALAAFRADMEAVEQETREEKARAAFAAAPSGAALRRPRPMI